MDFSDLENLLTEFQDEHIDRPRDQILREMYSTIVKYLTESNGSSSRLFRTSKLEVGNPNQSYELTWYSGLQINEIHLNPLKHDISLRFEFRKWPSPQVIRVYQYHSNGEGVEMYKTFDIDTFGKRQNI